MAALSPLPGTPDLLDAASQRYLGLADVILSAARGLEDLVDKTSAVGESVNAIRAQSGDVARAIVNTEPRYRETALALQEYSVHLRDAQQKVQSAIAASAGEQQQLPPLQHRRQYLETDHARAMLAPRTPDELEQIELDQRNVENRIDEIEQELRRSAAVWDSAVSDLDHAAERAIARIEPALSRLNDSLVERIGSLIRDVDGFMTAVRKWASEFLTAVLFDLVVAAIALVVVVIVLATVFSIIGIVLGLLIATGVVSGQNIIDAAVAALLALIPVLVPGVALILLREAATPTPEMTEQTLTIGDQHSRKAGEGPYTDALRTNGDIDTDGGVDDTEVSIIRVFDSDGNATGWRVTLPSTQDWQIISGDTGALNDLGSNIALMLAPDVQAAYERAVLQAMRKAGIQPADPVMLVGFSQGGILAGKLASTVPPPFNVQAIFVAGAPIDAMRIPDSVSVISLQHRWDPVHQMDGASHTDTANWVTVHTDQQPGDAAHGAEPYRHTAKNWVDGSEASAGVKAVSKIQAKFFSDNEIEHLYAGHE